MANGIRLPDTSGYADGTFKTLSTADLLANEYSTTSAYAVDSLVYHDGQLYRCITAVPTGGESWTDAHWSVTTIDDSYLKKSTTATYSCYGVSAAGHQTMYTVSNNNTTAYSLAQRNNQGELVASGYKLNTSTTVNASIKYDDTNKCIKFVFE